MLGIGSYHNSSMDNALEVGGTVVDAYGESVLEVGGRAVDAYGKCVLEVGG